MNDMAAISGVEIPATADYAPEQPRKPRGFAANPQALAQAVATRQANREARRPASLPGTDENAADATSARSSGRVAGNKRERNLQGMEQMIFAMHLMVANATGYSELRIDGEESHRLADALANVADHYKVNIAGKPGAILGLIYAAGSVYGPRAVALFVKARQEGAKTDDANSHTGTE